MKRHLSRAWRNFRSATMSKQTLIMQMATAPNPLALEAVGILHEKLCFQDGSMRGADLSGAHLQNVRLARADLFQVRLRNANLAGCYLGATNLEGADLQNAVLRDGNLREVRLPEANLSGADLQRAHMAAANLRGAILTRANLRSANLWRAKLQNADLTDADLSGANLDYAEFDTETILPDGSNWMPGMDITRFTNGS